MAHPLLPSYQRDSGVSDCTKFRDGVQRTPAALAAGVRKQGDQPALLPVPVVVSSGGWRGGFQSG